MRKKCYNHKCKRDKQKSVKGEQKMRKVTFKKVEKIAFNWELKQLGFNGGVFTINGMDLVMVGADYTSNGMRTYLKPLDEVLKNQDDLCWLGGSEGAVYYVDNKNRKLFDAYNK